MIERAIVAGIVVVVTLSMLASVLPKIVLPVAALTGMYLLVRVVMAWLDRW